MLIRSSYAARTVSVVTAILGGLWMSCAAKAQDLGLEGPTGVFVTPLAYVLKSPSNNLGMPSVGYHFLDGGSVIGYFSKISITDGAFDRIEFGYTRDIHQNPGDLALSSLWHSGFDIVHAKVNIVPENAGNHNWIPAISGGFLARMQVRNVGGAINGKDTHNEDGYIVATKTITETKAMPIMLSGGFRGTNSELFGMAGNATRFQGRAFGAAALVFTGPAKSSIIFASEVSQQPQHPEHLADASIPTTFTYDVRVVPVTQGEGRLTKLNIDFGIAQIANHIAPGVDLKARHQVAMGISYGF